MNIVLLTPRVWDSTWGQEKNLVEELSKHHQLTVLDLIDYGFRYASKFQGQSYETPEGVTILKRQTALQAGVLLGVYTEFKNLWDFLLLKKARQADVVISYLTAGCLFMLLAAKLLRKNILLIYADDYAEFFRSKSSLVGWFTEHIGTPLAAKLADRVVTTAHKLKEDVISFNPNTIVIPNGVHVQKLQSFRNTEKEGKGRQAALEGFTVGFVGGFGDWVNFDIVLAAAAALPDVRFKLIGNGDRFDDVHLNAEKLENVWVPGILPYNEVLQELAVMDVCLIPFHINRITDRVSPIKLFEYWAMKKPVISTRFYEVQKIAEGKIFFIDSTDELQNVILRLQKSPDLREQMAEKGFREVAAYDWATLGQQYFQLLQTLSGTRMK